MDYEIKILLDSLPFDKIGELFDKIGKFNA